MKTIWLTDSLEIQVIDQTFLALSIQNKTIKNIEDTFLAIKNMIVRGAPLIELPVHTDLLWGYASDEG